MKGAGAAMCDSVYLKSGLGSLILESHIAAPAPFTRHHLFICVFANPSDYKYPGPLFLEDEELRGLEF